MNKSIFKYLLFSSFILLLSFVITPQNASAVVWKSNGYFTGKALSTDAYEVNIRSCDQDGRDPFPYYSKGNTYPDFNASYSTGQGVLKRNFIYYVERYYDGCGIASTYNGATTPASYNKARNKVGGKFIMARLTNDKTPSKTAFEDIVNNPLVTIKYEPYTYTINSAHNTLQSSSTTHDVAWETGSMAGSTDTRDSLVIYFNGTAIMGIKVDCGNMVGTGGIPWKITPTVTPSKSSALVGDTVTWNYDAAVEKGPTSSKNSIVTYELSWKAGGSVGTISSDSATGVSVTGSHSETLGSTGNYCSRIKITYGEGWQTEPGRKLLESVDVYSDWSCVPVGTPPVNYCRPVSSPTLYPINNSNYPALSYTSLTSSSTVSVPAYSNVPFTVESSNVSTSWGPYYTSQTSLPDNFTTLNTTGEQHSISRKDTTNHATGITASYDSAYTGYWLQVTDPITGITTPTHYDIWPAVLTQNFNAANYPAGAYGWEINYYYNYLYSTVRYSDGDTRQLTTGSAPTSTNSNGTSYAVTTVGPCYDYNLKTAITDPGEFKEEGNPASVTGTVYNNESYTSLFDTSYYGRYQTHSQSKNIKYFVTKITLAPGATRPTTLNNGGRSTSAPCAFYGYSSTVCKIVSQSTMVVPIGSKSVTYDYVVEAVNPGTVICFAFSAFTHSSDPSYSSANLDSGDYYHSPFSYSTNCVLVVKKPKVQIIAGDISVGKSSANNTTPTGNVNTSTSSKYGSNYGSWVEYAIYAKGSVSGLASGSALAGGRPSGDCQVNLLTYSNTNSTCSGAAGAYTFKSSIKDYGSLYTSGSTLTVSPATNNANSLNGIYYQAAASTINISSNGSTINNKVIISAPSSTVVINDDIITNFNNSNKLSQVIIIAKNIKIDQSVSRVDAWLLASGDIDTCTVNGVRPTQLTTGVCNSQLEINGPVVANKLYLLRTAGSDPGDLDGTPAETFNLRPDAYLWMYSDSGQKRWKSTYETELPPRL